MDEKRVSDILFHPFHPTKIKTQDRKKPQMSYFVILMFTEHTLQNSSEIERWIKN